MPLRGCPFSPPAAPAKTCVRKNGRRRQGAKVARGGAAGAAEKGAAGRNGGKRFANETHAAGRLKVKFKIQGLLCKLARADIRT